TFADAAVKEANHARVRLQGGFFLRDQACAGHRRNNESKKRVTFHSEAVLLEFQPICEQIMLILNWQTKRLPYNCAWARSRDTSHACAKKLRTPRRKLAAPLMKSNWSRLRRRIRRRKCARRLRLGRICFAKVARRRRALRFRNCRQRCVGI